MHIENVKTREYKEKLRENWKIIISCVLWGILSMVVCLGGVTIMKSAEKEVTPLTRAYESDRKLSKDLEVVIQSLVRLERTFSSENVYLKEVHARLEVQKAETDERIVASRDEARPTWSLMTKRITGTGLVLIGGLATVILMVVTVCILFAQLIIYPKLLISEVSPSCGKGS